MTDPHAGASGGLRVVAIADADSFVKWSASLLAAVPGIRPRLLLVRTPLTASAAQERTALAGTGIRDSRMSDPDVARVAFRDAEAWLARHEPDVVLLAGRGPFVRLMGRVIDRLPQRPVTVSGLPGMAIPAQRGALDYRRHTDLLVVHSHRERRAFAELGRRIGVQIPMALATLPFARGRERMLAGDRERVLAASAGAVALAERPRTAEPVAHRPPATDIVFAAQAMVPAERAEREKIADMLIRAAEVDPARRIVVKLRSRPGEAETHLERDSYPELLAGRMPSNLVISYVSMAEALATAAGLVTVSSTAAIEAVAQGVPVIALDSYGVSKPLLNTVFVGSGLLGGGREMVGGRFRQPHPDWLRDNYFHPARESTWWERVEELVALRRAGGLPARRVPAPRGGRLHEAWHRASVLGHEDRAVSGAIALAIGVPATRVISMLRRGRAQGGGRGGGRTWVDASTDFTLEPSPLRDSIRR
jgi:hypothetical protein